MKNILVVIPAYNEEANIENVIRDLAPYQRYVDYVIINDGSKDHTSAICHRNGFNIIDLPVNLGLAGAFQTGMKYAYKKGYKCAIQFDADGQHRPEYIIPMYQKMQEGYDIVIGSRFVTEKRGKSMRMLGNNMISTAIKLTTGKTINDSTSGMRMFNRSMLKLLALNINYGPEPDTVSYLLKTGAKVAEIQVHMEDRTAGESYLNFTKSILYMLRMMLSILVVQNFRQGNKKKTNKKNNHTNKKKTSGKISIKKPIKKPSTKNRRTSV